MADFLATTTGGTDSVTRIGFPLSEPTDDYADSVQITHIDGVPVARVDRSSTAPGNGTDVRALMVFGVSRQDEDARSQGAAELVARWAVGHAAQAASQVSSSPAQWGVNTTAGTTRAWLSGPRDAVKTALTELCLALGQPISADALAGRPSADEVVQPTGTAVAASVMFGLRGPGAPAAPPLPEALSVQVLEETRRAWFTVDNVAMAIEGDLPETIDLPLPDGTQQPRTRWVPRPLPEAAPLWVGHEGDDVVLLLAAPHGHGGAAIVQAAIGLEVGADAWQRTVVALDPEHASGLVDADGLCQLATLTLTGDAQENATALDTVLSTLAVNGPSIRELQDAITAVQVRHEAEHADVDAWLEATARGYSTRTWAHLLDATRLADADYVAASARDLRARAILLVPHGVRPPPDAVHHSSDTLCATGPALPEGTVFRPGPMFRTFSRKSRRTKVVVNDAQLGFEDETGTVHVLAWDSLVCAQVDADGQAVLVHGIDGCVVPVHAQLLGAKCVEAITDRARAAGVPVVTREGLSREAI